MNFEEILNKVLLIANYPEEKRAQFINTFYEYLFMKLVSEIRLVDSEAADKVMNVNAQGADASILAKTFEEISINPQVQAVILSVSKEVVKELVDDIAKNANEVQRSEILNSINMPQVVSI